MLDIVHFSVLGTDLIPDNGDLVRQAFPDQVDFLPVTHANLVDLGLLTLIDLPEPGLDLLLLIDMNL